MITLDVLQVLASGKGREHDVLCAVALHRIFHFAAYWQAGNHIKLSMLLTDLSAALSRRAVR